MKALLRTGIDVFESTGLINIELPCLVAVRLLNLVQLRGNASVLMPLG
jgi:hypothetical protein